MLPNYEALYLYQICDVNLSSRINQLCLEPMKTYSLVDNDCIDERQCKIIKTKSFKAELKDTGEFYKAFKGDIILCLKQNFIKGDLTAAIVEEDEILIPKNFAILTPKKYKNSDLIMWAFHQDYVLSQIKPLNIGRSFFQVTVEELSKVLVPIEMYQELNMDRDVI
jgi:hypothetical protein